MAKKSSSKSGGGKSKVTGMSAEDHRKMANTLNAKARIHRAMANTLNAKARIHHAKADLAEALNPPKKSSRIVNY